MKTAQEIYFQVHAKYGVSGGNADKYDIEAMETYAQQFQSQQSALVKNEWVSVDDRLPEDGQEVNVVVNGKTKISTFRINNGHKSFYCGSDQRMCYGREYITHWQPLPNPPKI